MRPNDVGPAILYGDRGNRFRDTRGRERELDRARSTVRYAERRALHCVNVYMLLNGTETGQRAFSAERQSAACGVGNVATIPMCEEGRQAKVAAEVRVDELSADREKNYSTTELAGCR